MSYRVKLTQDGEIEIFAETRAELDDAIEALRGRTSASTAIPVPKPKRASPKRVSGKTATRAQELMPKWLSVFRMLEASQNGVPAYEVAHQLGLPKMNSIGRASMPVRRLLSEKGLESWEDVVNKVRGRNGAIWKAGPMIGAAIRIVEGESTPG